MLKLTFRHSQKTWEFILSPHANLLFHRRNNLLHEKVLDSQSFPLHKQSLRTVEKNFLKNFLVPIMTQQMMFGMSNKIGVVYVFNAIATP